MTNKNFSTKTKKFKIGLPQMLLLFVMAAAFFYFYFFTLVPNMIAGFVVPLFQPTLEQQARVGFVDFDGLVWGSTSKDKELANIGKEITKDAINKEYIFDFSWKVRAEDEHGYSKAKNEWYVKAPILGEMAIILEPYIGFSIVALVLSFATALLLTMFMPSGIGFMAVLFDRQIENTKVKLRLQTGFSDDVIELLIMPDDKLAEKEISEVRSAFRLIWDRTMTEDIASPFQSARFEDVFDNDTDIVFFRNEAVYTRIKEFFSDFVVIEIQDTKNALLWRRNRLLILKGFRLYMSHHFTEKYSNFVTGLAYGGAAFLIVAVGIRGLKFIPAARPSFILLAIALEFTMLSLLALTLIYTEEEERMDRMLKKMEDANRSQLEALRGQQADIHQLSNALVGQTAEIIRARVETAIEDYMTSGDQIQKVVAEEIAKKIMFSLRDEKPNSYKTYGGDSRR
ncbi:MAG: hypothetical protein RBT61_01285 [Candidatus Kapabacteria bacterium]|jgi:hypothetical protein|nr:hypothetical protein [Candidatus Kapabacteria bacterium]